VAEEDQMPENLVLYYDETERRELMKITGDKVKTVFATDYHLAEGKKQGKACRAHFEKYRLAA
jgi:hypothetical protein